MISRREWLIWQTARSVAPGAILAASMWVQHLSLPAFPRVAAEAVLFVLTIALASGTFSYHRFAG